MSPRVYILLLMQLVGPPRPFRGRIYLMFYVLRIGGGFMCLVRLYCFETGEWCITHSLFIKRDQYVSCIRNGCFIYISCLEMVSSVEICFFSMLLLNEYVHFKESSKKIFHSPHINTNYRLFIIIRTTLKLKLNTFWKNKIIKKQRQLHVMCVVHKTTAINSFCNKFKGEKRSCYASGVAVVYGRQ